MDLKPHQSRYWLNPKIEDPHQFNEQVSTICSLYQQAETLEKENIHLISTDELTAIQALERIQPDLPIKPGVIRRIEFEYERHGTLSLIASFSVAEGKIQNSSMGPTRKEDDFVAHIEATIDTDPHAGWIFIVDQLNTHQSESLVRLVGEKCNIDCDFGQKGKKGVLKSMPTRSAFLSDITHRIRFVYTPKHASWLNQIEIWFSILVRRLLKNKSFDSTQHLKERILAFITYFNQTMSGPFRWTYKGRPLVA